MNRRAGLTLLIAAICAYPSFAQKAPAPAAKYLQAAIDAIRSGDFQGADGQLQQAVKLDPGNPETYNLLGFVSDQTGRSPQAIHYYEKALNLAPDFAAARNNLGSAYLRSGQHALAIAQFEKTLRSRPNDLTAHYNLGLIFLQTGAPAKALEHLQRAHAIDHSDPAVYFLLARSYFALNRRDDGLATALAAQRNSGQGVSDYFMYGALLLANQEFEPAAASLAEANRLSPHTPEILSNLARAQFRLRQDTKALKTIQELIEILMSAPEEGAGATAYLRTADEILSGLRTRSGGSFATAYLLAESRFLEKDYAGAIQVLKDAGNEGDPKAEYWNLLGMSHAGANQLPDAARALLKAIDLDPQRTDLYFNLASIYQKGRDSQSAIKILDRVNAQKNAPPEVSFSLGLSYFNLENYSTALETFNNALKARPDFAEAEYFKGRCYAKMQKTARAAEAYRKVMAMKPGFYQAPFQLALLDLQTGQSQQAVPLLQRVIRINPGYPDAHFELGKIFAKDGSVSPAITEFERAIALNADYDGAYYQLGRLYEKIGNAEKAKAMFQTVNENKERRRRLYQQKVSGSG